MENGCDLREEKPEQNLGQSRWPYTKVSYHVTVISVSIRVHHFGTPFTTFPFIIAYAYPAQTKVTCVRYSIPKPHPQCADKAALLPPISGVTGSRHELSASKRASKRSHRYLLFLHLHNVQYYLSVLT